MVLDEQHEQPVKFMEMYAGREGQRVVGGDNEEVAELIDKIEQAQSQLIKLG